MKVKIHKTKYSLLVAICDEDLIGKTIENKNLRINLSERFYKGEDLPEERVIAILKDADSANLVGKKAVKIGLKAGVIKKDNIKEIKEIPFAISV